MSPVVGIHTGHGARVSGLLRTQRYAKLRRRLEAAAAVPRFGGLHRVYLAMAGRSQAWRSGIGRGQGMPCSFVSWE